MYTLEEDGSAYVVTNYHVVYDADSDTSDKISDEIYVFLYGMEYSQYGIPATYVGGSMNYDIAVLRSGKARKNDPPIPADLAPISGKGKRTEKAGPEEQPVLAPIRFRYSTEQVVEDGPAVHPEIPENAPEGKPHASRRRRRNPEGQAKAKPETAPQTEQAQTEGEAHRPTRRRPNRRRKPPKPTSEG